MEESPLHLAKRETQWSLRSRPAWVGLVAAGLILGVAGPFGTDEVLRLVPRLLYWCALTVLFYFVGSFSGTFLHAVLERWRMPHWPSVALAGAGAGTAIFALLVGINIALFSVSWEDRSGLIILGANVIGISMIVTAAIVYIKEAMPTASASQEPKPVEILNRLPFDKRGALYALSVSDHYVEVITANGTELVLMRLGDAIKEVGDTPGLQVHRSHWVAQAAIAAARRDGAKAILTLKDGREIPASRTYVPALKEAGVLPTK